MNRLKVIWQILTRKDWILVRYEVKDKVGLPFDLYLPQGFAATYKSDEVVVKRLTPEKGKSNE